MVDLFAHAAAQIRFGSVCSGIEAASVAWHPLGWQAAWFAEIEPFPCAVLAHHYPTVPNLGDMTTIAARVLSGGVEAPDVLAGGTPCQAFSVAGLRGSLADERGNLTLKFVELADAIDTARSLRGKPPAIVFWENVPGVLSTKDNAFGCFLAGLAGEDEPLVPTGKRWPNAGYVLGPQRAVAWRILDAQYFGLAQRRRRVFVVASARDGLFDPAAVLFEWDGVRRDSAPSRESGKVAPTIPSRSTGGGGLGTDFDLDGGLIHADPVARCVTTGEAKRQDWETCNFVATCVTGHVTHTLKAEGFDASEDGTGREQPIVPAFGFNARQDTDCWRDRTGPLDTAGGQVAVAVADVVGAMSASGSTEKKHGFGWGQQDWENGYCQPTPAMQVRRLTPVECERLQGFPDNWTLIPWRKKPASECPDGPRYKALGNSWAVPVVRWIGSRIASHHIASHQG